MEELQWPWERILQTSDCRKCKWPRGSAATPEIHSYIYVNVTLLMSWTQPMAEHSGAPLGNMTLLWHVGPDFSWRPPQGPYWTFLELHSALGYMNPTFFFHGLLCSRWYSHGDLMALLALPGSCSIVSHKGDPLYTSSHTDLILVFISQRTQISPACRWLHKVHLPLEGLWGGVPGVTAPQGTWIPGLYFLSSCCFLSL